MLMGMKELVQRRRVTPTILCLYGWETIIKKEKMGFCPPENVGGTLGAIQWTEI